MSAVKSSMTRSGKVEDLPLLTGQERQLKKAERPDPNNP